MHPTMSTPSTHEDGADSRALTVNETIARFPATMAVFNRFGIDTCCGGGVTIEEAARRDGLDLDALLDALAAAAAAGA
jgi:regulator of cell morphogenesis and NO signaling